MGDEGGARRLCGLLADPGRARVFAAAVLGIEAEPAAAKATRQLTEAGLLDADGRPVLTRLADAAAGRLHDPAGAEPDAARAAVLRHFLAEDGSLTEIPATATKRLVVLEHISARFEIGVTYPERMVTLRLLEFHPDHAALRRYLIDAGLLERRDGVYWRSGGPVAI